ncbi:MAG: hypothetical protein A2X34_04180 [Elusimicrobia bacterium GWC2_51_8]|nr:MAG: hypothetical protein A2X33_02035 [Elusimicrobia bacterium GWA2_51_34]OGR60081.1 MAG: hypothetical protein A2X34_04180 [Elusimicrobia bacterium GWC2_51_8]OGR85142.1 MAG: hypothetical protein A2021_09445 [Elusimicrobia bacterium GWF2_52_66]HAF94519.1 hypothetical protein [Elusimicrobiota bacterium]HCE97915.1 hypothetical protein [Elusimicrobiota bacterium]
MDDKRKNCIILLVDPPESGKANYELRTALGEERALHISADLMKNSYAISKKFKNAISLLSYESVPSHPNLTWLDPEDPGFLDVAGKKPAERLAGAFALAFNTGAQKALFLSHLSPAVRPDWLYQAFDAAGEKTISLGLNQDGSFYLLAITHDNLKILEGVSYETPNAAAEVAEKAKKNKLTVFTTPETFAVKSEETLRQWLDSKTQETAVFPASPPADVLFADASKENHVRKNRRVHSAAKFEHPKENPPPHAGPAPQ